MTSSTKPWAKFVHIYLENAVEAVPAGKLRIFSETQKLPPEATASTFVYGSIYRGRPKAVAVDPVRLELERANAHASRVRKPSALSKAWPL